MAAIVLAGGQSRRMGRDKTLLIVEGESLVQRAVRIAGQVAQPVYLIADRPSRFALPGVRCVADDLPGAGPLGAVVTGLRHAGEGYHVVLACDMPFVRVEVLSLLMSLAAGHDAAVPWVDGLPEPLCAVYSQACLKPFRKALDEGRRAVYAAMERIDARRVNRAELEAVDPGLRAFLNINEPGDWPFGEL